MDMLQNMRAFVVVARTGSFTAAAQTLNLATSVVTKRVSQLERSVGTVLLRRTTRKVMLSSDGEYHLERIKSTILNCDETLAAIRKGQQRLEGPLRIKVPTTLAFVRLNRLIGRFASEHPGVDVEVLPSPGRSSQSGSRRPRHCDYRVSHHLRRGGGRDLVAASPKLGRISKLPCATCAIETSPRTCKP